MFGLMGGDFDDDFLGMNAMNMQMRSMNRMMNSLMPDPFNMLAPFDGAFQQHNALMERGGPAGMGGLFGFPAMPNMNRLLSADIGAPSASYFSSTMMSMTGPDGRPQVYQTTSSSKTGPGGVRETRNTVQDSSRGLKKMAIGHHIGDRAHIIEKEQDLRSGQLEERQEFINLDEEEAEQFDQEFSQRASFGGIRGAARAVPAIRAAPQPQHTLTIEPVEDDDDDDVEEVPQTTQYTVSEPPQPAKSRRSLPTPPAAHHHQQNSSSVALSSTAPATSSSSLSQSAAALHDALSSNITSRGQHSNNHNGGNSVNMSNNNNYLNGSGSRRSAGYHRLAANGSGATPRRPLRTPPASPLATAPTSHNHSTASSPSIHPHPYNTAAARRNHRPKHTVHQSSASNGNSNSGGSSTAQQNTGAVRKSKSQQQPQD